MKAFFSVLLVIGVIIATGFYFQWEIIMQGWPFLIVLLCPLMHIFGGHNHK